MITNTIRCVKYYKQVIKCAIVIRKTFKGLLAQELVRRPCETVCAMILTIKCHKAHDKTHLQREDTYTKRSMQSVWQSLHMSDDLRHKGMFIIDLHII